MRIRWLDQWAYVRVATSSWFTVRCLRRKVTFFLLVFCSIKLPDQLPTCVSEYRLDTVETHNDWRERAENTSLFLSLFVTLYIYYIVMMGLGLVTAIYMIFGTVFIVCTLGVSWATYNNRLHGPSLAIGVQSSERCDKLYWKRTTK